MRPHIPDARDAAFDEIPELLHSAQRGIRITGGRRDARRILANVGSGIPGNRKVHVQIDQARHHGLAGYVEDARVSGPSAGAWSHDTADPIVLDHYRRLASRGARAVED